MSRHSGKKSRMAALCQMTGTGLLLALVLACLPLTVPRVFGYQIYTVISGSMEPAIPVGSLLYIQKMEPEEVAEGEVVAYYGTSESGAIITHRVLENRVVMGELITKGDANERADHYPVPYGNVIGKTVYAIPRAGIAAELLTSMTGKLLAGCAIGAAMLLHGLAALIDRFNRR